MPSITFERDIKTTVPEIQNLFASVVETCCDGGDVGITALARALGVHRKLAWQVRNVAYSADPYQATRFMPTSAGIDALIAGLSKAKVGDAFEARLREASDAFESIIQRHAGDRTSLEMLVEARRELASEHADLKWREKAFLGNSFIFGAQAKTQLSIGILNASTERPGWFDLAQVRGLIGLTRVRPNLHWLVGQSVVHDPDLESNVPTRVPLNERAAADMDGVPVMPEFCSEPQPRLRRRPLGNDLINDELLPAPVGFTGQQTIVTGEVIRALSPIHATSPDKRALFGAVVRTPSEVFVFDHFVHRELFPDVTRELCVFSELNSPVAHEEEDRLPVSESIEYRGRGISVARTPDVTGYPDMLASIFRRLDWNPDDFDLYRVRMTHPPMPASVVIRHPFPAPV